MLNGMNECMKANTAQLYAPAGEKQRVSVAAFDVLIHSHSLFLNLNLKKTSFSKLKWSNTRAALHR